MVPTPSAGSALSISTLHLLHQLSLADPGAVQEGLQGSGLLPPALDQPLTCLLHTPGPQTKPLRVLDNASLLSQLHVTGHGVLFAFLHETLVSGILTRLPQCDRLMVPV